MNFLRMSGVRFFILILREEKLKKKLFRKLESYMHEFLAGSLTYFLFFIFYISFSSPLDSHM